MRSLDSGEHTVAIIGLGYVGLPLAHAFWQAGLHVHGLDIDQRKIDALTSGESYIKHFSASVVDSMNKSGRFTASSDFATLARADAILICVPTPLGRAREPDLSFVERTTESIAKHMRAGALVVLESTTYPGTTTEVVAPILEQGGLKAGKDFHLAFSPEREDPGSGVETRTIPKIVGGVDEHSGKLAAALYGKAFSKVHLVRDAQTAEAVKITENIFRAVNIALVNELKIAYSKMGIDVWDVIDAAKTKPFGYMAFYPGPGLGGHCIPIDPFYLSWKARTCGVETRFIELAGEVNRAMPQYVVEALVEGLNSRLSRALNGAKILIVGLAYKKNVDDTRESPAFAVMELLKARGANLAYYDPFCPVVPMTREHAEFAGMRSIAWTAPAIKEFDAAVIVTDHDDVDYGLLAANTKLIIDTRNATRAIRARNPHILPA